MGSDLKRMSQLAYPESSQIIRDKRLRAICFRTVRLVREQNFATEGITSLRIAIERARTIKLIQKVTLNKGKRM